MKKSLNFRLLAWAAASIFFVAFFITIYSSSQLQKDLMEKEAYKSKKFAQDISSAVSQKIANAFEVTKTVGNVLSQVKDKAHPWKISREEALQMMSEQFKDNKTMFGLWTGWEPNAFDGKDDSYKSKAPSDATGRFVPYMTRKSDGTLNFEALVDYEKEGAGDYYQLPKKSRKSVIIPPYTYPVNGKNVLMISLAYPLVEEGTFFGVAGTDIDLSFFQELAKPDMLPPGSRIIIYDKAGTIVGFSHDEKMLLKNIFKEKIHAFDSYSAERLKDEKGDVITGENNLSVLSKIKMLDEEWFVEIVIPKSVIVGPIYKEIAVQAFIGALAALLALGIGFFLIKKMTSKIIGLADRLKNSAEVTRDGSNTVKEASFQVSSATQQQAAAIQETATTLDEISAMVNKSVDNARNSSDQANESFLIAEEGKRTVEQMRNSMEDIKSNNEFISAQIESSNKELEEIIGVIKNISEKTKVIDDIVFQTKLLSFNASVEAARAGDQGKGFAVVAEEVGNLAAMSGNSSKEINELLEHSIKKVESTIFNTRSKVESLVSQGQTKVNSGVSVAERCEEILNKIVTNVSCVKESMKDVTVAAEEQSKGVKNISDAMNMLDKTTQDNTKTVHETAAQSERLFKEADNLAEIILELEEEVYGKVS